MDRREFGNQPATPSIIINPSMKGLTKREHIAALALQGLLAGNLTPQAVNPQVSREGYIFETVRAALELTDVLLGELAKEQQ